MEAKTHQIDKIVYSLWTKPSGNILKNAVNWHSPKAQLACLALSVLTSKAFFSEIELVTDSEGWEVIKQLNLPFTSVKTILDDIPESQYDFWALGKIHAYKAQDKPFVHLDNDAILWKGLPKWALDAPIFVQNTEDKNWFKSAYASEIEHATSILSYFPKNWNKTKEAYCTGIFGGTDLDFIQRYCKEALKFINDKRNADAWKTIENKGSYCIIFEQYILACLIQYYKKDTVFFDKYLNKKRLRNLGYTHIWGAKNDKNIEAILLKRLKQEDPKTLERVLKLFKQKADIKAA
ncbi:DUF6734 family protein [Psychroserpens algicola]|uniref:DUF6734 family protein n=1 Tax=Psychroserpens algicola TaxID=1719034 RepID=UPI001952CEE3|nr:DUF6734 family protein [Psychroserpens algicola]